MPLEPDSPTQSAATAAADSWIAATASLATIMQLPVLQRSTVVLVDVLEYSLAEAVEILGTTLPAVKSALHRGRTRLKTLSAEAEPTQATLDEQERTRLRAYAESFNARDFDALRSLLAEDVQLDLVNRVHMAGRQDVSVYFTRYSQTADWRFTVGMAEGRLALLVSDPQDSSGAVTYVVLLDWSGGNVRSIRDFRFARYVVDGLVMAPL